MSSSSAKERPILFSAPMVRAILSGEKTQTRRIVKPQPSDLHIWAGWCVSSTHKRDEGKATWARGSHALMHDFHRVGCPYGRVGDRLWVRETCRAEELESGLDGIRYIADDEFIEIKNSEDAADGWCRLNKYHGKRGATVPPIHMPRWASRILLEITGVKVERLKDISEADAMAEGAPGYEEGIDAPPSDSSCEWSYRASFQRLWESINGHDSWNANPWVWCIEFKRIAP